MFEHDIPARDHILSILVMLHTAIRIFSSVTKSRTAYNQPRRHKLMGDIEFLRRIIYRLDLDAKALARSIWDSDLLATIWDRPRRTGCCVFWHHVAPKTGRLSKHKVGCTRRPASCNKNHQVLTSTRDSFRGSLTACSSSLQRAATGYRSHRERTSNFPFRGSTRQQPHGIASGSTYQL